MESNSPAQHTMLAGLRHELNTNRVPVAAAVASFVACVGFLAVSRTGVWALLGLGVAVCITVSCLKLVRRLRTGRIQEYVDGTRRNLAISTVFLVLAVLLSMTLDATSSPSAAAQRPLSSSGGVDPVAAAAAGLAESLTASTGNDPELVAAAVSSATGQSVIVSTAPMSPTTPAQLSPEYLVSFTSLTPGMLTFTVVPVAQSKEQATDFCLPLGAPDTLLRKC